MLGPSAHVDTFTRDNLPPEETWPEILLERPEFQHPERLNAAVELIDAMVGKGHGLRPAIVSWNESFTYRDLMKASNRIAHVLTNEMGLVPGARVLLRGANNPRMVACWAGVLKAGMVAVATMPLLRAGELRAIVEKGQVEAALCDRRLAEDMEACAAGNATLKRVLYFDGSGTEEDDLEGLMARASPQFEPVATGRDDVALLGFTSGTTGNPKATMHFHRDILAICDGYAGQVLQPHPEDIFIGSPPIAFTFGLGGLVTFPLRFGAAGLLLEDGRPPKLIEAIDRFRPTVVFTAPTAYRAIAEMIRAEPKRWDLSSLRLCVSAGETLSPAIYDLWMETVGAQILDGIGSTEMLHIFISNRPETAEPGFTGTPVPGYRAKIVDAAMQDVPEGEPVFLAVKGPTGCRYLADDRQARYVRDGWNVTGDVMTMDDDGRFSFVARSDDMIVSSGYNISGPEVENALLSHADVVECAVIGVADEERGEIVQAHVVLKEGVPQDEETTAALQEHVKANIAPYKYPRSIVLTPALPKTQTGKIQRFRLRQAG